MRLGLCCQYLDTDERGREINRLKVGVLQRNRWLAGKYDDERIRRVWLQNANAVLIGVETCIRENIQIFRMPSKIFPLVEFVPFDPTDDPRVVRALEDAGATATRAGLRVTCHPDQFVVINNPEKYANSLTVLREEARVMDLMGIEQSPYSAINIHGGGRTSRQALIDGIRRLQGDAPEVADRLTLENCEFSWSVARLLPVSRITGVPIVFDSHHHSFNDGGLTTGEALRLAMSTWNPNTRPLTHISNTPVDQIGSTSRNKLRSHSRLIYQWPEAMLRAARAEDIDVEIEAKGKNHAITAIRKEFPSPSPKSAGVLS